MVHGAVGRHTPPPSGLVNARSARVIEGAAMGTGVTRSNYMAWYYQ